jgi:benzoate 4-monooxygenase
LTGKSHLIENELHQKYGPIVRIGPSSLSLSTLEAYDSLYGFHQTLEKGEWYQSVRDPITNQSGTFGIQSNDDHRDQRKKLLSASFSSSKISECKSVVLKYVDQLSVELDKSRESSTSGRIDLAKAMHKFSIEALFEVCVKA